MKIKKNILKIFINIFLIALACFFLNEKISFTAHAETIEEMNKRIEQKKNEIDDLLAKVKAYQDKIKESKKQAVTLNNQLGILNDEIEKNELDIQITQNQIQKTNLEIQTITITIDQKEKNLEKLRKQISEFMRELYRNDQVSYVEILVMNNSFSDFFDQYQYLQNIQNNIHFALIDIQNAKSELELQKSIFEEKRKREVLLKKQLETEKGELLAKSNEKETILNETKRSEKKFQAYVNELKAEQNNINAEIVAMEKKYAKNWKKIKKKQSSMNWGPCDCSGPLRAG